MQARTVEIIVGTYEAFLLGYQLVGDGVGGHKLVQSFATKSHRSSVRSVAVTGRLLASGGADDLIHLYDMVERKQMGVMDYHSGTVSCLQFSPSGSHLVSGADDGTIAVCRTGSWQLEKLWPVAHSRAGVTDLSVHPSGKAALSVGQDGKLHTWNLVKGRRAYVVHLVSSRHGGGFRLTSVVWSPAGSLYAVAMQSTVKVYGVDTAGIIYTVNGPGRIASICFINEDVLCVGGEDGMVALHGVGVHRFLWRSAEAHDGRVKGVTSLVMADGTTWVASASSTGQVILWSFTDGQLRETCRANASCRVTCVALCEATVAATVKVEEVETEEEGEGGRGGGENQETTTGSKQGSRSEVSTVLTVLSSEEEGSKGPVSVVHRKRGQADSTASAGQEEEEESDGNVAVREAPKQSHKKKKKWNFKNRNKN